MSRLLSQLACGSLTGVMLLSGTSPLAAQTGWAVSSEPTGTQSNTRASSQNDSQAPVEVAELPDSPSATQAQSTAGSGAQSSSQSPTAQPSGTAAAPTVAISGNAASRPAGAAIAPPKQRQVRSFLLKMGFIVGAGAALGTVIALTAASPSKVPGSH